MIDREEYVIEEMWEMIEVGKAAPGFALPASNGELVKLSDYRGKKMLCYISTRRI
ncbi:hypothetical protein GCM10020331_088820 [Ectobacillus funiculus]